LGINAPVTNNKQSQQNVVTVNVSTVRNLPMQQPPSELAMREQNGSPWGSIIEYGHNKIRAVTMGNKKE